MSSMDTDLIVERSTPGGRVLTLGTVHATHFPGSVFQSEEWRIVGAGLPVMSVHTEADARVWLEYLGANERTTKP